MPPSPSLARKRRFCRKRRPYNSHSKKDFSPVLALIGPTELGQKSIRAVAAEHNIRPTTLFRMHKKWVLLNKPAPYFMIDLRGKKTILSAVEENELAVEIKHQIDDERIIRRSHVKAAAIRIFRGSERFLRS